jgi:hypothetical protein
VPPPKQPTFSSRTRMVSRFYLSRRYNEAMLADRRAVLRVVADDLASVFGARLHAVVAYGWSSSRPVPSLALVSSLTLDDLEACAARAGAWRRAGAATPLLLTRTEFARSLDAFPIEYGDILDSHAVVVGQDPFEGLTVNAGDRRRACEVQAKSHLLHLREDYLEAGGRPGAIEQLVRDSAPAFAALLRHLARLDETSGRSDAELVAWASDQIGLEARVVGDLLLLADSDGPSPVDPLRLFPAYVAALERLVEFVDRWRGDR